MGQRIASLPIALAASLVAAASAAAAPEAAFEWSMPSRFGAQDEQGRVVEAQPQEVRDGPWTVHLRVTGPACAEGAVHRWSSDGRRLAARRLGPCRYAVRFPREGAYPVRLDARADGRRLSGTRQVTVQDWLIVSIGDSVASGEAVPDVPHPFRAVWQSVRCHRSARSAHALAARRIEDGDLRSSVTFVHLACSGATIATGLLGPYGGVEPPVGEPALEPQVAVLRRIAAVRPVDAVLLSVGANDSRFGEIVRFCALPARDCFEKRLPVRFGGDGVSTVREAVQGSLRRLPDGYRRLAAAISPPGARSSIPPSHVYPVEYFDPTRDANGNTCKRILGSMTTRELEHAQSEVLAPLNATLATAARDSGWRLVGGVSDLYRKHGYCAKAQAWVTDLRRSFEGLGGTLKGRFLGTLHPNRAGHEATSNLIAAALEDDLLPAREPPPPPQPTEDGAAGSSDEGGDGLDLPDWLAPLLILLGFALGALYLVDPRQKASLFVRPFATLAKTIRPLLLPVLVALAVATSEYSPVVQILASAVLVVVGWRLIVVPEREKSAKSTGSEPSWGGDFLAASGKRFVAVLALGGLLVLLGKLLGVTDPYFRAVDDASSALLLVAVVLLALAGVLRLFSFATTLLRLAVAALLALVAFLLLAEAGLLPSGDLLGDEQLDRARDFALIALGLLLLDALLGAVRDEEQKTPAARRSPVFRGAAVAGLSVAAVSAAVLAASALIGLLEASKRERPLNPPESQVADARPTAPGAADAESGMELARRYAPVLAFAEEERWAPTSVDAYVEAARLSGPPGTRPRGWTTETLPSRCPAFGEISCYELSIDCDDGTRTVAAAVLCEGRTRQRGRLYREGAVYVRLLEKGRPEPEEPRGVFVDRGPYGEELDALLQYWLFYPYNEWRTPVFAGELVQRHEADWEAVTIGLDAERRPLFVADSAHCGGSWEPWGEVEASTRLPGPRTHPLVAVAKGSHANYQNAAEKRAPDWASCAGAPEGATTAISYASNIRDETEFGWLWYPPADGWLPARAKSAPMNFPGSWGADDRTILKNFKTRVLHEGEAPRTPSLQGLWRDPVRAIFCGRFKPRRCN